MSRTRSRLAPLGLALLLLSVAAVVVVAWTGRNELPDGYQNEFLHVGNALDLWEAAGARESWLVQYLLTTNYWPPGFYLWPWPGFGAAGASHVVMVLGNLGHFAVLLWACFRLGEEVRDRGTGLLAMALVSVFPSVSGNLVRFEPSVALTAWATVGALCLLRSRGFRDLRWSLAFGVAASVGLLMDRLSMALILGLPALFEGVLAARRRGWTGLRLRRALIALAVVAVLTGWWHWEFFHRHLDEVLSQTPVGEIDAAGHWTEQRDALALATLLFYPATLLDSQAGLVPGLAALGALAAALVAARSRLRVPLLVVLCTVAVFTVIQKKQVYYTLPMLGCVAVILAERLRSAGRAGRWLAAAVLLAGVHQLDRGLFDRGLPLPEPMAGALGDPILPATLVAPRYPQVRPPRDLQLPIDAVVQALPPGDVVVFSDDQTWFEGFLVLQLRERLPGRRVRGLISDPQGTYEWFRTAGALVVVSRDGAWPRAEAMQARLEQHHYTLDHLPPVVEVIVEQAPGFGAQQLFQTGYGPRVGVFSR